MKNRVAVLATIVVIVIIAVALVARKDTPKNEKKVGTNSSSQTTATPTEGGSEAAAVITYTDNGFSNSVGTVSSGAIVKVVNQSKRQLNFASNPHPVHTDDPELNAGTINPGDSKSFIVKTKGTWGFHNHLREQDEGSITIK